jgi:uncharacterized protein
MRWEGREESTNVEDRRGMGGKAAVGGGGLVVIIIGIIIALINNQPPQQIMQQVQNQLQEQAAQGAGRIADPELLERQARAEAFTKVVLKDTEDVWDELFPKLTGKPYRRPVLVFYDGNVSTQGCGSATSAVGPFYCPADYKVYLDLSFFEELQTKFRAPGEFACAYVIAHEVAHHIQNLLGWSMEIQQLQARASKVQANQLSVRLELQADFLAGVWAHHAERTKSILEAGDLAAAIRAAEQIGDDTLQRQATGRVVPDAFTHGTAKQRKYWFELGFRTGQLEKIKLPFELDYSEL